MFGHGVNASLWRRDPVRNDDLSRSKFYRVVDVHPFRPRLRLNCLDDELDQNVKTFLTRQQRLELPLVQRYATTVFSQLLSVRETPGLLAVRNQSSPPVAAD